MIKKNQAYKRLIKGQDNSTPTSAALNALLLLKAPQEQQSDAHTKLGVRLFSYHKSTQEEEELETGLYYVDGEMSADDSFTELQAADRAFEPGTGYFVKTNIQKENLQQAMPILDAALSFAYTKNESGQTTSSWRTMAQSIGVGDAAWSASSMVMVKAGATATATTVMSCLFPFALGILVGYLDYCSQVQRYRELNNGKEPPQALKEEYFKNSLALTFKMAAAVGGWTFGYEIMAPAFEEGVKSILKFLCGGGMLLDGGVTHVSAALAVGLGAALFLVTAAIIADISRQMIENPNKTFAQAFKDVAWKDMAKLFVCSFFAGIIWYGISILPFNGALQALGFDGLLKEVTKVLFESGFTYFAISKSFQALKPIDSYNDYCDDSQKRGMSNYIPGPGGVTSAVTNLWDSKADVCGAGKRVLGDAASSVQQRFTVS